MPILGLNYIFDDEITALSNLESFRGLADTSWQDLELAPSTFLKQSVWNFVQMLQTY